ncbi:hypothetical protein Tco_0589461, partial [Tanacetum coccineum]
KAPMQAATPGTENARRRRKAESTLEAKQKKDLEWEVPRHTLLEVLKSLLVMILKVHFQ